MSVRRASELTSESELEAASERSVLLSRAQSLQAVIVDMPRTLNAPGQLNKMENPAFDPSDRKVCLEMTRTSTEPTPCRADVCKTMHAQYKIQQSKLQTSPWHWLKTVFLVSIVLLLLAWLVLYVLASKFEVL